jgi:flagellar motor protein MotB
MRAAIVILSVLLVAAVVAAVTVAVRYADIKDTQELGQQKVSELTQQVEHLTRDRSQLQAQVAQGAECAAGLENAKQRIAQLEEKTSALTQQVDRVTKDRSQLQAQVAQGAECAAGLKGATQHAAQLEEKTAALEAANSSKDAALKASEEKDRKSASRADTLQAEVVRLGEQVARKDAAITRLEEELGAAKSHIPSLRGEIAKGESELGQLQQRLAELQGQRAQLERTLAQMRSAHDAIVSDLKEQIDRKEVSVKQLEQKLTITFIDRVLFEFGKATLTAEGKASLEKVGRRLRNIQGQEIQVVGHADDIAIRPDYRYKFPSNWELSAARASTVVRYFQEKTGLDPKRMEAVGRSFYDPIATNDTPEGRAQNRRVEIAIGPRMD